MSSSDWKQNIYQPSYLSPEKKSSIEKLKSGKQINFERQQQHHNRQQNYLTQNNHHLPIPSISNQTSQYQSLIYENKIQILNDRLQCYMQQVQNLRKTNTILINKLSTIEQLDQELQTERTKNFQLREKIQIYREKIEIEKEQNEDRTQGIKKGLQQKEKFLEIIKIQHQKALNKKQQQISYLRDTLKDKIKKLELYEKKIHNFQIERLNSQQDTDNFSSERDSVFTKNSSKSRFNPSNNENTNTLNTQKTALTIQEKARKLMTKDHSELKIMMKTYTNAQKCLQMGGQQLSMIGLEREQQKSMMGTSRLAKSKINKTYCK